LRKKIADFLKTKDLPPDFLGEDLGIHENEIARLKTWD
jgi:hypothetical protein